VMRIMTLQGYRLPQHNFYAYWVPLQWYCLQYEILGRQELLGHTSVHHQHSINTINQLL